MTLKLFSKSKLSLKSAAAQQMQCFKWSPTINQLPSAFLKLFSLTALKLSHSNFAFYSPVPKTIKSSSDYISDLFKINITSRPTKKDVSTSTLEKSAIKRWAESAFNIFTKCFYFLCLFFVSPSTAPWKYWHPTQPTFQYPSRKQN